MKFTLNTAIMHTNFNSNFKYNGVVKLHEVFYLYSKFVSFKFF